MCGTPMCNVRCQLCSQLAPASPAVLSFRLSQPCALGLGRGPGGTFGSWRHLGRLLDYFIADHIDTIWVWRLDALILEGEAGRPVDTPQLYLISFTMQYILFIHLASLLRSPLAVPLGLLPLWRLPWFPPQSLALVGVGFLS